MSNAIPLEKHWFEVYTMTETKRVQAHSLREAFELVDCGLTTIENEVIGIIEIDLFHKGASPKPDLI